MDNVELVEKYPVGSEIVVNRYGLVTGKVIGHFPIDKYLYIQLSMINGGTIFVDARKIEVK